MRVYFLEEPLGPEDLAFVKEAMEAADEIQQVRIPYLLPVLNGPVVEKEHKKHEGLLRKCLRRAGIGKDHGKQIVFVAPKELYWHATVVFAIYQETGSYPYFVQTEKQREAIGNPGGTRILDGHGLMGLK